MVIGEVAGPFGVRGEIKVQPLTDFPERYKKLKHVFLGSEHSEHTVTGSRVHQGRILLKVEGVDTPEQVAALGHVDIALPRAEAVALPEGSYYLDELIGVRVRTTDDRDVGSIKDVLRTGSNDVWVVERGTQSVLIPAIADAVHELNVKEKYAVIACWVLETED
jgi:16S rRNA processing protein RimM